MQYARERTQDGKALVDFAMDVFEGKPLPMVIRKPLPDGTVVETKFDATPTLEQRFEAMNFLAERGFGRPTQRLEGEVRVPIAIVHRTPPHDPLAPPAERVLDMNTERALEVMPEPPRRALKGRIP
jgi:hypothetical protein